MENHLNPFWQARKQLNPAGTRSAYPGGASAQGQGLRGGRVVQLEAADHLGQLVRPSLQRLRGGGGRSTRAGVLLRALFIWLTAPLIPPMPLPCSWPAWPDLRHDGGDAAHAVHDTSRMVAPASCTRRLPVLTWSTESSISCLIWLLAWRRAGPGCAPRRPPRQSHALPGARGFHGRIQRQDVGREGDAVRSRR